MPHFIVNCCFKWQFLREDVCCLLPWFLSPHTALFFDSFSTSGSDSSQTDDSVAESICPDFILANSQTLQACSRAVCECCRLSKATFYLVHKILQMDSLQTSTDFTGLISMWTTICFIILWPNRWTDPEQKSLKRLKETTINKKKWHGTECFLCPR